MSALRIPVLVMRTLIVPTLTVLIAVPVKKDSMEMEQLVKVCKSTIFKNNVGKKLKFILIL